MELNLENLPTETAPESSALVEIVNESLGGEVAKVPADADFDGLSRVGWVKKGKKGK